MTKAILALENGACYEGVSLGKQGKASGEVVFNTSMTGYQEVLTDPSYAGQIVAMTCPQIGNYGVAERNGEFVVGGGGFASDIPSNRPCLLYTSDAADE